jgi:hypothetical protein
MTLKGGAGLALFEADRSSFIGWNGRYRVLVRDVAGQVAR